MGFVPPNNARLMANSIRRLFPVAGDNDPLSEAQRQDRERRIREDNEYFQRTGINPRPRGSDSPLVPLNGQEPEDVADDADAYIEGFSDDFSTPSPSHAHNQELQEFRRREQVIKDRELKKKAEEFEQRPKNTILDIEL